MISQDDMRTIAKEMGLEEKSTSIVRRLVAL